MWGHSQGPLSGGHFSNDSRVTWILLRDLLVANPEHLIGMLTAGCAVATVACDGTMDAHAERDCQRPVVASGMAAPPLAHKGEIKNSSVTLCAGRRPDTVAHVPLALSFVWEKLLCATK